MEFKVIFSPHQEFLVEREFAGISSLISGKLGNHFTEKVTRILPPKSHIGIHILDLYRKETGDDQVSINDIPSSIAGNWRDDEYLAVSINEEIARSSGKFLEYDTFYCEASLDVMMEFETLEITDNNTDNPKLVISIDKDRILGEWIEQGYPDELCPANKIKSEESED